MSSKPISVLRSEAMRATGMDRARLLAEVKRRQVKHRDYCRKSNKKRTALQGLGRCTLTMLTDYLPYMNNRDEAAAFVVEFLTHAANIRGLIECPKKSSPTKHQPSPASPTQPSGS